jgi:Mn2+/Fe2+ NRAMP family transporter
MDSYSSKNPARENLAQATTSEWARLGQKLGPGLLFAASSVGTSHLVQSTRAGADYGLAMAGLILTACLVKYPAFRFGSDYAVATGQTLIDSYFRQGRWAVVIYGIEVLVTMFIATAAVGLVTSGLVNNVLSLDLPATALTAVLLGLCAAVLISGRYQVFEKLTKGLVALFMLLILVAVALSAPGLESGSLNPAPIFSGEKHTLLFMIALAGWMPTAVGASVFQSLWVCAKSKALGRPLTKAEARFDFNLGYGVTVVLAMCFLIMGTVLMYQPQIVVSDSSTGFAAQLIGLFTQSIGAFAYPIIAVVAVAVMLSTLLTLIDACPRALGALATQGGGNCEDNRYYTPLVVIQCCGAMAVLLFFMSSFKTFIDLATSVAFLTAPLLAFLNHRAVFSNEVAEEHRPGVAMKTWSQVGIVLMGMFGLYYLHFMLMG